MTIFDDLYDRFHEFHTEITRVVGSLPIEALDWNLGPETNSICVLVVHLTAAERFWIGDVALGEPSNRIRDEEFRAYGLTADDLKQRLTAAEIYTLAALHRMTAPDLEVVRKSPRNEKTISVGWCLLHALEHTALHTGHIQLTRQLWQIKGGK